MSILVMFGQNTKAKLPIIGKSGVVLLRSVVDGNM